MTDMGAHVWTIICSIIIFIMALLVWFMGYANLHDTMASDNLQDATRVAMFMASDNSARAERGSFVINKDKFRKYMNNTKIRQLGDKKLNDGSSFSVYYLPDDESTDAHVATDDQGNGDFSGNDHNVSTGADTKDNNTKAPEMASWNTDGNNSSHGYEAIRGLRVVMNPGHNQQISSSYKFNNGATQKGTSKKTQHYIDTFTATDIVQTNAKDALNDTYNDLTR